MVIHLKKILLQYNKLVFAAIYNCNLHIPLEYSNGKITYAVEYLSDIGYI